MIGFLLDNNIVWVSFLIEFSSAEESESEREGPAFYRPYIAGNKQLDYSYIPKPSNSIVFAFLFVQCLSFCKDFCLSDDLIDFLHVVYLDEAS